jgi:hypothetical protein
VAILGTAIFRLQRERNTLVEERDGLIEENSEMMSDGMELKQHCDGIERALEAVQMQDKSVQSLLECDLEAWKKQSMHYQTSCMLLIKEIKDLEAIPHCCCGVCPDFAEWMSTPHPNAMTHEQRLKLFGPQRTT